MRNFFFISEKSKMLFAVLIGLKGTYRQDFEFFFCIPGLLLICMVDYEWMYLVSISSLKFFLTRTDHNNGKRERSSSDIETISNLYIYILQLMTMRIFQINIYYTLYSVGQNLIKKSNSGDLSIGLSKMRINC